MPHLVTSHQGQPHVLAINDARRNAATYGGGKYVLPLRDQFAASVPNSNTIRIQGGDAMVCGRHWAIDGAYEDYTLDNGTPGYNRIDIVVARIETSPAEKVEIIVRKGEETAGEPVAPSHIDGDLLAGDSAAEQPLYEVRIEGLTPHEPVPLFEVAPGPYVGHVHDASDIDGGVIPVGRGGTGVKSLTGSTGLIHSLFDTSLPDAGYIPVFTEQWGDGGYMNKQTLRKALGLGDTLGALPIANGGTGVTSNAAIALKSYPVNAVYFSRAAANPASLFGGTWVEITDTKLFLGIYMYRRTA